MDTLHSACGMAASLRCGMVRLRDSHSSDMVDSIDIYPVLPAECGCMRSLQGVSLACYSAVGATVTFISRVSLVWAGLSCS